MADMDYNLLQTLLRSHGVDMTPSRIKLYDDITFMRKIKPGDHIAYRLGKIDKDGVRRPEVIWHSGIYVGGDSVIHMHPCGDISKVSMKTFMERDATHYTDAMGVVKYKDDDDIARAFTVVIAQFCTVDIDMQKIVYDKISRNCDGFATFCRSGRCEDIAVVNLFLRACAIHRTTTVCQHKSECVGGSQSK